jgi:hypothetical protein
MRGMAGGSYLRSLQRTFMSELLSMNLLMAGMMTVRPPGLAMAGHGAQHQDRPHDAHAVTEHAASATPPALLLMAFASLVALSAGLALALSFRGT